MPVIPINYWAVLVAAAAQFVLGALWYGPLFGRSWTAMLGWTKESMDAMMREPGAKRMMARSYVITAIGALLMSYVLAHALIFAGTYLDTFGVSAGLMAGFWNWLGFVAPATIGAVLWEQKPWKWWFLNAGYYLVGLLMMGVILAMWI